MIWFVRVYGNLSFVDFVFFFLKKKLDFLMNFMNYKIYY